MSLYDSESEMYGVYNMMILEYPRRIQDIPWIIGY